MSGETIFDVDLRRVMRREVSNVLTQFTMASTDDQLVRVVLRALCELVRCNSGFLVCFVERGDATDEVAFAAYGGSEFMRTLEAELTSKLDNGRDAVIEQVMELTRWQESAATHVVEHDDSASVGRVYCAKIEDEFGRCIGFVGLESTRDLLDGLRSAQFSGLVTALVVRLWIARGSFGSQAAIVDKAIHDINGGLAIVGLQTALLAAQESIPNDSAIERLRTGLAKVDHTVRLLDDFNATFFSPHSRSEVTAAAKALRAAVASMPMTNSHSSRVDLRIECRDDLTISTPGHVAYWFFRSVIGSWANTDFWSEGSTSRLEIDLRPNDLGTLATLTVKSRVESAPVGPELIATEESGDGPIVVIGTVGLLVNWVTLFGGSSSVECSGFIRTTKVSFPVVENLGL